MPNSWPFAQKTTTLILKMKYEEEICKTRADEDDHDRTTPCRSFLPLEHVSSSDFAERED
jgi:hypothetical protein